jgi:hypothetical protein
MVRVHVRVTVPAPAGRVQRIALGKFVELTATNAVKAYGLHPGKGTIAAIPDGVASADRVSRPCLQTHALAGRVVDRVMRRRQKKKAL